MKMKWKVLLAGTVSSGLMALVSPTAVQAQACGDCYETPVTEIRQHCVSQGQEWCDNEETGGLDFIENVSCDNEFDSNCHHALRGGGCSHHYDCPLQLGDVLDAVYAAVETDDAAALAGTLAGEEGVRRVGDVVEVRSCGNRLAARIPISRELVSRLAVEPQ